MCKQLGKYKIIKGFIIFINPKEESFIAESSTVSKFCREGPMCPPEQNTTLFESLKMKDYIITTVRFGIFKQMPVSLFRFPWMSKRIWKKETLKNKFRPAY